MTRPTDPAPRAPAPTDPLARERAVLAQLENCVDTTPQLEGYQADAKGRLVPESLIPEHTRLEDDAVRTICAYALDLHRQIHRFRGHSYDDLATLDDLVAERYGRKRRGGAKGNRTYMTLDGRMRITVQVQDRIAFGPELQVARELVDECITDWAEGTRAEVQALIAHAFEPDREGQVSRDAVFALRRLDIDDPRWRQAQQAITDSIRVAGSASYLRVHIRAAPDSPWRPVPIDMTGVPLPEKVAP